MNIFVISVGLKVLLEILNEKFIHNVRASKRCIYLRLCKLFPESQNNVSEWTKRVDKVLMRAITLHIYVYVCVEEKKSSNSGAPEL